MVRTGIFPAWMGWLAIVLGVLSVTPAGFFAILLMLAWIIAVSLMLYMRTTPAAGPLPPPTGIAARRRQASRPSLICSRSFSRF